MVAVTRWIGLGALLVLLAGGPASADDTVDCAERFPIGTFALTPQEVAGLAGWPNGFSLVHVRRTPLRMRTSGSGDPCELVYGGDVLALTDATTPGALVAGCAGDFRGTGSRDHVVLLSRQRDRRYIPYVVLGRGPTARIIPLPEQGGDGAFWFGPFCLPRPRSGVFQAPDFEGTGQAARVPVVGDLITVGWWTYYWRPDRGGFDSILTTD